MESSVAIHEASDAVLARLAAGGERVAAGELLSRRMPMLAAMARRITLPAIDADDLLAEAIAHLLSKWAEGDGPQDGIDAYVIRSMRNRVVDEIRSPRSRTSTMELMPEPALPEPAEFHQVELHREFTLVQSALGRLPSDQRRVLQATVVDGRKPADLVTELGRPAGAVYALQHRAKKGLQRSLLQIILEQSDEPACQKCSRELPKTITTELVDDPNATHLRECEHCSRGWERYLLLMSCGGAACVLLVATLMTVPIAPAAAAISTQVDADGGVRQPSKRPPTRVALGIAAAAAGVALAVWGTWGALSPAKPTASMSMAVTSPSAGLTDVTVSFTVDKSHWTIDEVTLVVPEGETLTSSPVGWTCRNTSPVALSCTVEGQDPRGGTLSFAGTGSGQARYELVVHATSGRTPITGTAEGTFPR